MEDKTNNSNLNEPVNNEVSKGNGIPAGESSSGINSAPEGSDGIVAEKPEEETVTMNKTDFEKAIQSAEDKVRGKMSKTIKDLEAKVQQLTPKERTQAEIELEERIAKLEASEREVANQKKRLDIQEQLSAKGLDKNLVDYIKDDVDLDGFTAMIDGLLKQKTKSIAYIPSDHASDEKVTLDDYKKMTYSEKLAFSEKFPEAYKRITGNR